MCDLKGIEVHDVFGVSKPITKLVESIFAGLGKIYEPIHIHRMAKAKAKEIEVISDVIFDNQKLPIEYSNGAIGINSKDANDLVLRTKNRLLYQEMKKQQNIDSVIAGAYNIMEQENDVDPEQVDKDWIIRFFNSVEDISNADLQNLWSQVLAGEVKHPKSFSMRTLDALRNISKDEALLFEKICKIRINSASCYAIYRNSDFLKKHNITYADILLLDECGLINSSGMINSTMEIPLSGYVVIRNNTIMIRANSKSDKTECIRMPQYPFSAMGNEIASLYENPTSDLTILDIARLFKKDNECKNVLITAHKIKSIKNNEIKFNPEDLLITTNNVGQIS